MTKFIRPEKLRAGDRVAIVSPSSGLPGALPMPFELGLRRLRDDFGLEPVEYPTTRRMGSTPEDRAADLHAAFADPAIRAVMASIGGDDEITVLPHLDEDLIRANPKPFFGYSDNTCLLAFLSRIGIVGYHGGSVMVHLGRPVAMHPLTADSLRAALFGSGQYELSAPDRYGDVARSWSDPATFEVEPETDAADPWEWHDADGEVIGPAWGGCLEVLAWLLMADLCISEPDAYAGSVLIFETSEEMPSATEVYRILRNMGERGLLGQFAAVMVGRPKAWSFGRELDAAAKRTYRSEQKEAVLRGLAEYAPSTPVVFNVDFGHTDPQLVIPIGGEVRIDGRARRIWVSY